MYVNISNNTEQKSVVDIIIAAVNSDKPDKQLFFLNAPGDTEKHIV